MPLNNPLGFNRGFNLVAACPVCNNRKSDKVDLRVAQGYFNKFIQSIIFGIQKIIIIVFVGIYVLLQKMVQLLFNILLMPLRSGNFKVVVLSFVVYAVIACVLLKRFF